MTKGNLLILLIIGASLILLWVWSISMLGEYRAIEVKNEKSIAQINILRAENKRFEDEINYYQVPENLEKKLRENFNYKKPGEKMIIIVPSQQ